MTFFDDMKGLADEFTAGEFFTPATLTRMALTDNGPVAGTVERTAQTIACRAVLRSVTTKADNGALVSQTTVTLDTAPLEGDTLTIGGKTYKLGSISTVRPDGTDIIYKALVVQ